jgi:carboxylate-amine ligase
VQRVARQRRLEIFGAGTHPFARWYDQEVSEGERYATLIERTQWWGRHMLIFGVHVHVGVDSVGKVLPILNGRAGRYGLDAEVILDAENRERLVTDDLHDLLSQLAPGP